MRWAHGSDVAWRESRFWQAGHGLQPQGPASLWLRPW